MMGWATEATTTATYEWDSAAGTTTSHMMVLPDLPPLPHALTRPAQLEELDRLAAAGRRQESPRERSRFGWHDAPRRPCYRAVRRR